MAEFQTIAAAFDVAKLAYEGCKFLRKVHQADQIVEEVYDRTLRLRRIIDNVKLVLNAREERGVSAHKAVDIQTEKNINDCVQASKKVLLEISDKVGGFQLTRAAGPALLERVKIALRHPGVRRLQVDLEARISALQADLLILQLSDQAHTHATIRDDHTEVLNILDDLRERLDKNNKMLHDLRRGSRLTTTTSDVVDASDEALTVDADAIASLECSVRIGEDLHERYTSEYAPDDRSIRFGRGLAPSDHDDSSAAPATPESEQEGDPPPDYTQPRPDSEPLPIDDDEDDSVTYPLELLDGWIQTATDRAAKDQDQSHFNQAEYHLQSAIKYSEDKERYYGIPFLDRAQYQEEVARLYQKQGKSAEAVAKVHQLLNSTTDPWAKARQYQLLASIYFERHQNYHGPASSSVNEDIDKAERYGGKAYAQQYKLLKQQDVPDEEVERHAICTDLMVRIFETRDKTVEANYLKRILSEGSSSLASESMRRVSSLRPNSDFVIVGDKQALLIQAIRSGDTDQIDNLLRDEDIDIERRCEQGKTLLFYAVESADETIVNKLLNPDIGADVNGIDRKGLTVLHHAAAMGLLGMVRFLLHHDAEIEARDKRNETPVMKAVQADRRQVVQELYDSGANFEAKDTEEWTVLHFAVRLDSTKMSKQVLDICPELRDAVDTAGKTALHHCTERDRVEHATALLMHRNHVDVHAVDSRERSALYFAASRPPTPNRERMVALLVKQGARIDDSRPPPRWREYTALNHFQLPRRSSKFSRHDSVSTEGSVGTTSTAQTKLSRIFSGRLHLR